MKPDFFDDNDVLNIQGSSEDEIDGGPSIECKSRYILVFELYNEDELKKCEEFKNYNDKINYLNNLFLCDSEKATNKYHIFN